MRQHELIYHATAIADAVPVPVFLYNIPDRTGNTIEPATALQLMNCEDIVGIKGQRQQRRPQGLPRRLKVYADFDVLSGPDHLAHQGFLEGCSACISGLANDLAEGVSLIWKHFPRQHQKSKAAQDFPSPPLPGIYTTSVFAGSRETGDGHGGRRRGPPPTLLFSDADLARRHREAVAKYSVVRSFVSGDAQLVAWQRLGVVRHHFGARLLVQGDSRQARHADAASGAGRRGDALLALRMLFALPVFVWVALRAITTLTTEPSAGLALAVLGITRLLQRERLRLHRVCGTFRPASSS